MYSLREDGTLDSNGMILHEEWHIIVANIDRNNLYSLPLNEYYASNFGIYNYNSVPQIVTLCILENQEAAERMIEIMNFYHDGN